MNLINRPRRLRTSPTLRSMMRETRMSPSSLIYPIFAIEGENIKNPIASLPGQFQWSPDRICEAIEECIQAGVEKVMLFGLPAHKDEIGSGAWAENGIVQQAIRAIKAKYPDFYVITDVCMCEYTSHGHCGILCDHYVDNDKTLECLAKIALSHAQAGADMVAPSDMMDGRVAAIRKILDDNGFMPRHFTARSAMPQARHRRSVTESRIRWTRTTAARPCWSASWMCRRARTSSWSSRHSAIWTSSSRRRSALICRSLRIRSAVSTR